MTIPTLSVFIGGAIFGGFLVIGWIYYKTLVLVRGYGGQIDRLRNAHFALVSRHKTLALEVRKTPYDVPASPETLRGQWVLQAPDELKGCHEDPPTGADAPAPATQARDMTTDAFPPCGFFKTEQGETNQGDSE